MAYDFNDDVKKYTGMSLLDPALITWAVDTAKIIYICDNADQYDDTISDVDNRLVSMLASSFVTMTTQGVDFPSEFTLDEFTIKMGGGTTGSKPAFQSQLDNFFFFLKLYQSRGCDLQYVDASSVLLVATYDGDSFVPSLDIPEGVE